jgi:putative ABC transport system substrate-binding protein
MDRRSFLGALIGGLLAAPRAVQAQAVPKRWRIGLLYEGAAPLSGEVTGFSALREALRELGYVESREYLLDLRFAEGRPERLPELAEELTRLPVDVLITGSTPSALAAMHATRTIPIVAIGVADPVSSGLARGFDRPGGNVTGTALALDEVSHKWLELLKVVRAGSSRVAVLHDSTNAGMRTMFGPLQESARALAVTLTFHDFTPGSEAISVFDAMAKTQPHGLVVLPGALFWDHRKLIFEQAVRVRLPTVCAFEGYTVAGGLMSYGPNTWEMTRKAAIYVDKIFKGARPADLAIERPSTFRRVINLKTAKALGVTISPSLLQRADQVIE